MEQQPEKEKMVRAEELINLASRVSPEDKPSVRGGRECKEVSWTGGDSGWFRGMTSPRKRLSSQRKEEVCDNAGNESETELTKRVKTK